MTREKIIAELLDECPGLRHQELECEKCRESWSAIFPKETAPEALDCPSCGAKGGKFVENSLSG